MAELRHSLSMGARMVSSPVKRDEASSPLFARDLAGAGGGEEDVHRLYSRGRDRDRDRDKEPHRSFLLLFPSSICSFFSLDDPRVVHLLSNRRLLLGFLVILLLAGLVSLPPLWIHLTAPYLCVKEGITLRCPKTREPPSLWENPYSSTTSWKPCAARGEKSISGEKVSPENETNGYIFIHAEGGLNQQRIAICNAVAVAKIMNATLILPVLKQDQIWKDQTKLEDIFDVDHFIEYLKDDAHCT
ncbi:hypothetical protein HPP92_016456 [Vanilla planifolia]|uniref:O-fucosyltransferase family protein n=1 Tax=Vanilla planifolia TaxID=51239 RepID=A0A835UTD2_VANPL|nr:hypothetical protein HPP92_016456 [Vanilla planifolia]